LLFNGKFHTGNCAIGSKQIGNFSIKILLENSFIEMIFAHGGNKKLEADLYQENKHLKVVRKHVARW
jgi:hypothetical protein